MADEKVRGLAASQDSTLFHTGGLKFVLRCVTGKNFGKQFVLDRTTLMIGRSPNVEIFIDEPGISRKHAKVTRKGDTVVLTDLNSANGTKVNDKKVTEVELKHNDQIAFDEIRFVLTATGQHGEVQPIKAEPEVQATEDGSSSKLIMWLGLAVAVVLALIVILLFV